MSEFSDAEIEAASVEVWDSIPPSGKVRCDIPYSRAAARLILQARRECDEWKHQLDASTNGGTEGIIRLLDERDAALVRVKDLETKRMAWLKEWGSDEPPPNNALHYMRMSPAEAWRAEFDAKNARITQLEAENAHWQTLPDWSNERIAADRIAALEAERDAALVQLRDMKTSIRLFKIMNADRIAALEASNERLTSKRFQDWGGQVARMNEELVRLEAENAELRHIANSVGYGIATEATRIAKAERLLTAFEQRQDMPRETAHYSTETIDAIIAEYDALRTAMDGFKRSNDLIAEDALHAVMKKDPP